MHGSEERGGSGLSRRRFLALGGSSVTLAAALTACGGPGDAATTTVSPRATTETERFGKGDIGILNYLLTLEHLEKAVYVGLIGSGFFKGRQLEILRKFANEEAQHVVAVTADVKRIGGKPAPKPSIRFPLKNPRAAIEQAMLVEELVAAAYLGQLTNAENPAVVSALLAIHSVEGRHTAVLKSWTREPIVSSGARESALDAETVLRLTKPWLVN
jgi:hypothetical protein